MENKITNEEIIILTDNFINDSINEKKDYNSSLLEFEKLSNFIKKYNFIVDLDFCINLLQKNVKLEVLINIIFSNIKNSNGHYLKINSSVLNIYDEYEILQNFIIAYCIINKIEIIENDYEMNFERLQSSFSSSDIDVLKLYLSELNKKILAKEEERNLALKIKAGDKKAKDELIESNLRLVVSIAKKYVNRGLSLEDLIQEGNVALVKAVNKYNVDKGYKFSTYATFYIKGYISRAIEDKSRSIRIPVSVYPVLNSFKYEVDSLTKRLGKVPSIKEISKYLNLREDKINEYLLLDYDIDTLNKSIGEELDTELIEFIPSNDKAIYEYGDLESLRIDLFNLLEKSKLTDKEKQILLLRFFNKKLNTFKDIGNYLGISHQAAQDACKRAITKLRDTCGVEELAIYCSFPKKAINDLEKIKYGYDDEYEKLNGNKKYKK